MIALYSKFSLVSWETNCARHAGPGGGPGTSGTLRSNDSFETGVGGALLRRL
jgi:hypothetical protein